MAQVDALGFYASVFDTVEVNATFHGLPSASTVRSWYDKTPHGFSFALKVPREITHDMRLERPAVEPRTQHFLRVASQLGDKCGPMLVQLPPSFERTREHERRLNEFLELLPSDRYEVAIELRHRAWAEHKFEQALRDRNVAWVLVEGDQPNARSLLFTADFTYIRWNRAGLPMRNWSELQYDRADALDWWAAQILALPASVKTVYGYMSNEFAGHAPASLAMLCERLGLDWRDPQTNWQQQVLF
ncbi:MAG TPA: DUF72 domain-containing protein [Chloroflexota bacterium]|nr:DUF72 domain-containing protein [Chloroflexota bacterium]